MEGIRIRTLYETRFGFNYLSRNNMDSRSGLSILLKILLREQHPVVLPRLLIGIMHPCLWSFTAALEHSYAAACDLRKSLRPPRRMTMRIHGLYRSPQASRLFLYWHLDRGSRRVCQQAPPLRRPRSSSNR